MVTLLSPMSLLQNAGLVQSSDLGVQKGRQNEPHRPGVVSKVTPGKGREDADKLQHPERWDVLLFDSIISQERFGVVVLVPKALQMQVEALLSATQGSERAVLWSMYTRSSHRVQTLYEESLLSLLC